MSAGQKKENEKAMTDAATQEPKTSEATQDAQDEKTVPWSRWKGLESQAKSMKAELEAFRKADAERQDAEAKAAEIKAKEQGEYEKLLAMRDEQLNALKAEIAGAKEAARKATIEKRLLASGATNPIIVDGLMAQIGRDAVDDDGLDAWIAAQKEAHPEIFKSLSNGALPRANATVGNPAGVATKQATGGTYRSLADLAASVKAEFKEG